ncbi:MAG: glycosyltransferase [Verrucomicrobiota bacterium]|jgi:glycosyltransferase involved in cell wall biosynthesis
MLLKPTVAQCDFSFIVTTRNNTGELVRTIKTLIAEAPDKSEMVIVDGSDSPLGEEWVVKNFVLKHIHLTYTLDKGKGAYPAMGLYAAMNDGIESSLGSWLIIMTAGDCLEAKAKTLLESLRSEEKDVVVFAQNVVDQSGRVAFKHIPSAKSIWPHQSVVLRRQVHEKEGLYPLNYRYGNEQYLFARIRKALPFIIRDEVLTAFYLGGITSQSSLAISRDVFAIRRHLGHGVVSSFVRSYITPPVRFNLERSALFRPLATLIRRRLLSNYGKPNVRREK